ncbi:MAG: SLC13 family permease, partial [Bacteroidota bacterium]
IGTPPNAIALKYLTGADAVSFAEWMAFAVPFVVVLLAFAWILVGVLYPAGDEEVNLEIKGRFLKNPKAYLVYGTFAGTIILWLTDFLHGLNAYTVALIPVGVFLAFGVITKEELRYISWDVLWLVAGGIALGLALDKTGLAQHLMESIAFDSVPAVTVILAMGVMAALMANFMSNTATANLILPLVAVLGTTLPGLVELGGTRLVVLSTTFACSMGMALPISTPPNALAFGTGLLETKDLAKPGLIVTVVGLMLNFLLMFILKSVNFF